MELNDDLLENRLHSTGNGGIPIGAGQEVGQASDDADTGLSTNIFQGLGEQPNVAARDDLGQLQDGIRTEGRLRQVPGDIGVAKKAEATSLRHH